MTKIYDRLEDKYIDPSEIDPNESAKRYIHFNEEEYKLKDVVIRRNGEFSSHGYLDETRQILFSGHIPCDLARELGITWETDKEKSDGDKTTS